MDFAVQDEAGSQIGYVCLYEGAFGVPASVLCGFDLLRLKAGRPSPWIAQGDVVREQTGTLVLSRLAVSPSVDEVGMGGSFFAEPEVTQDVTAEGGPGVSSSRRFQPSIVRNL